MFDETEETFISESRDRSIQWARDLLAAGNFVILDTETTGLDSWDEIIQIAVIDPDGNPLLNELVNPIAKISPGAEAVHHISKAMLEGKPAITEISDRLVAAVEGKKIVAYNVQFDWRLLRQSFRAHAMDTHNALATSWDCAMEVYARYYGEWNSYRGSFRWQRLEGGNHTALGDCLATLALIKRMAESKLTVEK